MRRGVGIGNYATNLSLLLKKMCNTCMKREDLAADERNSKSFPADYQLKCALCLSFDIITEPWLDGKSSNPLLTPGQVELTWGIKRL